MPELKIDLSFLETEEGDGYFIPVSSSELTNEKNRREMERYAKQRGIDFCFKKYGVVILGIGKEARDAVIEILELE